MLADLIPLPPGGTSIISAAGVVAATPDLATGDYVFSPTPIRAFTTRGGNTVYLLDSFSFFGLPLENDYVASINPVAFPNVQLRSAASSAGVADPSYAPIPLARYLHDSRCRSFYTFSFTRSTDIFVVFGGRLTPAGTFPSAQSIPFSFAATIYAIRDPDFVRSFFSGKMPYGNFKA